MKRREFIALIGTAATLPFAVSAQQPPMPVIGFLGGADPDGYKVLIEALRLGLRDHGYVEGHTIAIEYRWAEGNYDRLPGLAAELVQRKVALIVTQGTPAAFAAGRATSTIPIVMVIVGNPVDTGLVSSLARPGGNITGSSFFMPEVNAKRVELLKELMPPLGRAGALLNPDNPVMGTTLPAMTHTAKAINVALQPINVRRLDELQAAFELAKSQVDALIVVDDGLFIANARHIAELAVKSRLPSLGFREYCEAGGLAAYGVDFPHVWRSTAALVDKILKGKKPADLPIEQASRFEFVINLKTARALDFEVPPAMSARADEVIE
jgi:putative ABC transport system substrate-binding protein